VVAPVLTLGEIRFEGSPRDRYLPVFRKTQPNAQYSPVDTEQPLRYVLRFAMRLYKENRQSGLFGFFRRVFDVDKSLLTAAEDFADGCRADPPFEVIQGHNWIGMASQDAAGVR
jgi:hypothetical protein